MTNADTSTRPTSIRLPPDLAHEIERTSREHDRTPADQHRHLLKLGLARLAELERLAHSKLNHTGDTTMANSTPKSSLQSREVVPETNPHPAERSGAARNTNETSNGRPGSCSYPGKSVKL